MKRVLNTVKNTVIKYGLASSGVLVLTFPEGN